MRLAVFTLLALVPLAAAAVKESPFGKLPDGREVQAFTLTNKNGMSAKVITYGAILTELIVPDKNGKLADVVLGFDNLDGYLKGHPYFGSNVGRCANRIANGKFTLEGHEYTLATNNGKHHLHGGKVGFDKKLWAAKVDEKEDLVDFTYESPDGEEGYPGTLKVRVRYWLQSSNQLVVEYSARTDKTTVCNIAHHSYFNLAGQAAGDILKHQLTINADQYTPGDSELIPTGKIEPVRHTPYDFTTASEIGSRIKDIKSDPVGYDVNYVLSAKSVNKQPPVAAIVVEPTTGRVMTVSTDEPGLQFYTGNYLDGKTNGKGGVAYQKYGGFCLEAQAYPDAINKIGTSGWSAPILKPGDVYRRFIIFNFTTK